MDLNKLKNIPGVKQAGKLAVGVGKLAVGVGKLVVGAGGLAVVGGLAVKNFCKSPKKNIASTPPQKKPNPRILIIVINVQNISLIKKLETEKHHDLPEDHLYQITQALGIFNHPEDFKKSDLSSYFITKKSHIINPSEYDIHLLKLEIDDSTLNFEQNDDAISRIDNFRKIQNLIEDQKFELSPRLPSETYISSHLYHR